MEGKSVDVGVLNELTWGAVISPYFHSIRKSGTAAVTKAFGTTLAKREETCSAPE